MTLRDLARKVLSESILPLTAKQVWADAVNRGLDKQVETKGKTPDATVAAYLYTQSAKPNSDIVSTTGRPSRFLMPADMKRQLEKLVLDALEKLRRNDALLLALKANERCLMTCMTKYLWEATRDRLGYRSLDWDSEYNRHGLLGGPKRVLDVRRLPDVVLHKRGTDDFNILVVEAKSGRLYRARLEKDRKVLEAMTSAAIGYRFGLHMIFRKSTVELHWYQNGFPIADSPKIVPFSIAPHSHGAEIPTASPIIFNSPLPTSKS